MEHVSLLHIDASDWIKRIGVILGDDHPGLTKYKELVQKYQDMGKAIAEKKVTFQQMKRVLHHVSELERSATEWVTQFHAHQERLQLEKEIQQVENEIYADSQESYKLSKELTRLLDSLIREARL